MDIVYEGCGDGVQWRNNYNSKENIWNRQVKLSLEEAYALFARLGEAMEIASKFEDLENRD